MFVSNTDLDLVIRALVLSALGLVWVVGCIRVVGLRSLSKMTNFDFVMTIALGSLLAGAAQATQWSGFVQALIAMVGLFAVQVLAAMLRRSSDHVEDAMQNQPTLLMRDGEILRDALATCRVAESDLIAKLREANVLRLSDVRAVILEATGDVSVMHGDALEQTLLRDVTGV